MQKQQRKDNVRGGILTNHETRKGIAVAHARVDESGARTDAEIESLITESLQQVSQSKRSSGPKSPNDPWSTDQRSRMKKLVEHLGLLEPIGHD